MAASIGRERQAGPREMVGIEYSFIVGEFGRLLAGKRLQKFQKVRDNVYRMRFEKLDVICELGRRMHITRYLEETQEADNFSQKVRKELAGKRLSGVEQLNKDRIIQFVFDGLSVVFEMFGKGNIILLKEKSILAALREEKWGGRELRRGVEYSPPPPPPKTLDEALDEKPVITSLIRLSFGKQYAKELLARAGISEKAAGSTLPPDSVERLRKELAFLPRPQVFVAGGKAVDFGIISFAEYANMKAEKFDTLSEAADRFYWENQPVHEPEGLKKLEGRLEKQQEYLRQLRQEEEDFRAAGGWFYANYAYAEGLIDKARKLGVQNLEKLKETDGRIKETNKEKRTVVLEV